MKVSELTVQSNRTNEARGEWEYINGAYVRSNTPRTFDNGSDNAWRDAATIVNAIVRRVVSAWQSARYTVGYVVMAIMLLAIVAVVAAVPVIGLLKVAR